MRAAALVRCSRDSQNLEHQRRNARRWAESHGHELEIIEEQGISGAAAKRPGLDVVMDRARSGSIQAVWAQELSRLGRSLVRVVTTLEALDALGVRVVVAGAGIDLGSAAGRLQAQIVAAFAEYEREMALERTMSGLEKNRLEGGGWREGHVPGRRPFLWTSGDDARLLEMKARGWSERKMVRALGRCRAWWVFRDVKEGGEWTQKASAPGRRAVRERLASLTA